MVYCLCIYTIYKYTIVHIAAENNGVFSSGEIIVPVSMVWFSPSANETLMEDDSIKKLNRDKN